MTFQVLSAGGGLVVVVGLAASAGGVVVAAEKVATTRPATTSRVVANLYFINLQPFCVRQYRLMATDPARLKISTLVPTPPRSDAT